MKKLKTHKNTIILTTLIAITVVGLVSAKSFAGAQTSSNLNQEQQPISKKSSIEKNENKKQEKQVPNLQNADHSGCHFIYEQDCAFCNRIYKGSPEGALCKSKAFQKYMTCIGH